ncbi:hypothetical protein [Methanolobus sp. WCC4]|uniref:hypothetical protein n=1 Tax=Methanolobus sp. WCC4 TaxID=3125784 RepID=UPI0030FA838E
MLSISELKDRFKEQDLISLLFMRDYELYEGMMTNCCEEKCLSWDSIKNECRLYRPEELLNKDTK